MGAWIKMVHNHALIQNIFSVGGGVDGDQASGQGWSNKFYHYQNPYFGKTRGGGRSLRDTHSPDWSTFLRNPTVGN